MTMATTGTVQRDDAAECRAAFEREYMTGEPFIDADIFQRTSTGEYKVPLTRLCFKWFSNGAAWKAAKGV